jgi:hypothetical protein
MAGAIRSGFACLASSAFGYSYSFPVKFRFWAKEVIDQIRKYY